MAHSARVDMVTRCPGLSGHPRVLTDICKTLKCPGFQRLLPNCNNDDNNNTVLVFSTYIDVYHVLSLLTIPPSKYKQTTMHLNSTLCMGLNVLLLRLLVAYESSIKYPATKIQRSRHPQRA